MVSLYEELGSYRAVAALVGCDHKTVKATPGKSESGEGALPAPEPAGGPLPGHDRGQGGRHRGPDPRQAMLRVLRAAGYRGSSRTLFRALKVAGRRSGE